MIPPLAQSTALIGLLGHVVWVDAYLGGDRGDSHRLLALIAVTDAKFIESAVFSSLYKATETSFGNFLAFL